MGVHLLVCRSDLCCYVTELVVSQTVTERFYVCDNRLNVEQIFLFINWHDGSKMNVRVYVTRWKGILAIEANFYCAVSFRAKWYIHIKVYCIPEATPCNVCMFVERDSALILVQTKFNSTFIKNLYTLCRQFGVINLNVISKSRKLILVSNE